ncbi:MAG: DUF3418 domain-containing protein, partial [Desulfobacterales bacterium]
EMVETSRLFARTAANINGEWLEALGGELCRRTYLDPHWDKNRGTVMAAEQVSLFGLIIVPARPLSYGSINPEEASDIFIQKALVEGDVKKPFRFMQQNQALIGSVKDLENRLRRRDLLVGETEIFAFYRKKLPRIFELRALAQYIKRQGTDRFLRMKKEDLLLYHPDDAELALYPDWLELGSQKLECRYCFEPGQEEDGVTVRVPSALSPTVPATTLEWVVPGFYAEKITALIKGLPKVYRRQLVPVKETVAIIRREMPKGQSSLISVLGEFIFRRFGVEIPATAWAVDTLQDHLKMRIAITAPDGKELRSGRDPGLLRQSAAGQSPSDEFESLCRQWERTHITRWDFGDLPEFIHLADKGDAAWIAYPALAKDDAAKGLNLKLFRGREEALTIHKKGVAALYAIHFSKELKFLKRRLLLPRPAAAMAAHLGGPKRLEARMYDRIIDDLFAQNIRSAHDFYAHAATVARLIQSGGLELLEKVLAVVTSYYETHATLADLQRANRGNRIAVDFFEGLSADLKRLVPENFIDLYARDRLLHIVRYIRAVAIRAHRALLDFEKDRAKFQEILPVCASLDKLLQTLSPVVSAEKRQAIEDFFWLVEEYKVSVFAQELKTAGPVSPKRIEQRLRQIERMV